MRYPKTFQSGTIECPIPHAMVERMVGELVREREWSWVTFESGRGFVEVALKGSSDVVINIAYPFKDEYQARFARDNLSIPAGLEVMRFKTKGWFFAGFLELKADATEVQRVAEFVSRVFPALYGLPPNYRLSGTYQG
ncbi:MAG: hypothetical protein H7144_05405 [Burkholderiales bacterium]|nr:hypothetical protein [Phycisphaerae bacterium]